MRGSIHPALVGGALTSLPSEWIVSPVDVSGIPVTRNLCYDLLDG